MRGPDDEQTARRALTLAMRTSAAIMGSRDEAADIAQDVTVDVLRSRGRLRHPDAFDAWVHKITVRHTLRALKKRRAAQAREVPLALTIERDEPHGYAPDIDLVLTARHALAQALTTLPPRQRIALALRYVHDLTDEEIAEALGCRRGTAGALLSRARSRLREVPAIKDLASPTVGDTP